MTWLLVILFAALAAGLGYFIASRRNKAAPVAVPTMPARNSARAESKLATPPSARYWGKQLVVPEPALACRSARVLDGQCFAPNKLPTLPLKDCTSAHCACRFEPVMDRRSEDERRRCHERRDQIRFEDLRDRRVGRNRRLSDHYDWRFNI